MRRRVFGLAVFIALSVSAGCLDMEDIDRRGFVTSIGIDAVGEDHVTLTAQIPLSSKMLPPGSSAGGGTGGKRFGVTKATAASVNGAFRQLQSRTALDMEVYQNKTIIYGTEAARRGLGPFTEFFGRSILVPPQAFVFVARDGTAADILEMEPDNQMLPGIIFLLASQVREKADRSYSIPFWQFRQRMDYETTDTYAPLIQVNEQEKRYIIEGLAAFDRDRMVGQLDPGQTQMFGLLAGKMDAGHLEIKRSVRGMFVFTSVKGRSHVRIRLKNGQPFFDIRVRVSGALTEMTGKQLRLEPRQIDAIEREVARSLQPRLVGLIHQLQRINSDIINFGERLRVQKPDAWKGKGAWKRVFPTVAFRVGVSVQITRDGIRR